MSRRRTATEELIKRVLGEDYLSLGVERYELVEDVGEGTPCQVRAVLRDHNARSRRVEIEGEGAGFLDALYHGLMAHYAREFQSLGTITFTGFGVQAQMETSQGAGADAECLISLVVHNSEGREFIFEESGRSLVAAALAVVVEAAEYFVNSERAFISVYNAMSDAKERRRNDLVGSYTGQLAELVNTTSYTQVIERIKSEL